jgi:hypothetical protein
MLLSSAFGCLRLSQANEAAPVVGYWKDICPDTLLQRPANVSSTRLILRPCQ